MLGIYGLDALDLSWVVDLSDSEHDWQFKSELKSVLGRFSNFEMFFWETNGVGDLDLDRLIRDGDLDLDRGKSTLGGLDDLEINLGWPTLNSELFDEVDL